MQTARPSDAVSLWEDRPAVREGNDPKQSSFQMEHSGISIEPQGEHGSLVHVDIGPAQTLTPASILASEGKQARRMSSISTTQPHQGGAKVQKDFKKIEFCISTGELRAIHTMAPWWKWHPKSLSPFAGSARNQLEMVIVGGQCSARPSGRGCGEALEVRLMLWRVMGAWTGREQGAWGALGSHSINFLEQHHPSPSTK